MVWLPTFTPQTIPYIGKHTHPMDPMRREIVTAIYRIWRFAAKAILDPGKNRTKKTALPFFGSWLFVHEKIHHITG